MKYTFLAISLKLIAVKMILNQQRRVSDENSENPALLSENHRLNTSIVAIPLFSSVSYEQRLLVILSSCNWMHRKHTRKHATGQYEQCESTFRRDALFATVICPEIFDRTILFFSPISTEKVVNFSKKKKDPAFGKLHVPESFYILMHWEIKISRYIIRSAMKKICSLASVIFSNGIFLAIQYRKFYFLHS